MFVKSSQGGHSAQVKIRLLVGGADLAVAQLGPDFLLVDTPCDMPPGESNILMRVDNSERSWTVFLTRGISSASHQVAIGVDS
jgi:hypothetical protein